MDMKKKKLLNCIKLTIVLFSTQVILAQNFDRGSFSGSFNIEAQTYKKDTVIDAPKVKEQVQSNGYMNLNYTNGGLSAGIRYEYYLNPLLGIDPKYKGQGIPYRYVTYNTDLLEITAGNYYEQFGSGVIFRSYEERALGYDNAMDGARVKFRPVSGLVLTGIIGTQRNYWESGEGLVRGGDLNMSLNDLFSIEASTNIFAGASFISNYQVDNDIFLKMPENVMAYSGRFGLIGNSFSVDAEYAYKFNNPNVTNEYNYNPGYSYIVNGSYFAKGISASLNLHKLDNMDFRSNRYAQGTEQMLGFVPPLTKQHTYRLASMYPYATKFNGEAGMQAEVAYRIPRNTTLGGKYGTDIAINFSRVQSIDTTHTYEDKNNPGRLYDSPFFGIGDRLYFQDINLNISRKFTNTFKSSLSFINLIYDKDILENEGAPNSGKVNANILVLDGTYRISQTYALKCELQHMWSKQDSAITSHDIINGNWLGLMAELTISPGWFISIYDDWNYGNESKERQVHYLNANVAYTHGSSRFSLGYGKQRAGILCVGGVCRQVPASNGFYLSVTTSF